MTRIRSTSALVLSTIAVMSCGAAEAGATGIIGAGNGAFNNTCANHGDEVRAAQGTTRHASGVASGLLAVQPTSGPANQCGDLGVPSQAVASAINVASLSTPSIPEPPATND